MRPRLARDWWLKLWTLVLILITIQQLKSCSVSINDTSPKSIVTGRATHVKAERRDRIGSEGTDVNKSRNVIGGDEIGNDERRILIGGDHCMEYSLTGTIFQKGRTVAQEHKVKMCHLKTFGKDLEEECQKEFMVFHNDIKVLLKSPSLLWWEGQLVLSLKAQILRRPGTSADCYGFACNHMYLRKYDKYLNPVGDRQFITMRSPYQNNQRSGPDDSRLFQMNNSLYSLFAVAHASGVYPEMKTRVISAIWDHQRQKHFIPDFQKDLMRSGKVMEKNWLPMVIKDELYIIRHLDPLQIMKCKIHENCAFVNSNSRPTRFRMDKKLSPFRGGTAFELYKYPYYVGIAHGTHYKEINDKYYTTHLVVLCVEPFRIVYISDSLQISPDLYSKFSGERVWKNVKGNFIFPTGILFESEYSVVIGAHVNDLASFLLRLEGIKEIISDVMRLDKDKTYQPPALLFQKFLLQRAKDLNITGES